MFKNAADDERVKQRPTVRPPEVFAPVHEKYRVYTSRNQVRHANDDTDKNLRAPFRDINRLPSGRGWPNHLFCSTSNVERSERLQSAAFPLQPKWCRLTQGGIIARFLAAQKHRSPTDPDEKYRKASPFITALKYFISLTCSKVGVCSVPNTLRISSRNRRKTWGLSASIATAKVRVDAVYNALLVTDR